MYQADLSMCFSCIAFAEVLILFALPVLVGNTEPVVWWARKMILKREHPLQCPFIRAALVLLVT